MDTRWSGYFVLSALRRACVRFGEDTRWVRYFILSAGGILLAAALIRFVIATGNVQALALPEPMLGIPLRYAVLIVGGIELTVALICLFGKQTGLQLGSLVWLSTSLIVFWIGLFLMRCHPQATCIGSLTDPLHLARGWTGLVLQFIPRYLLLGSYAAVILPWGVRVGRTAKRGGDGRSQPALGELLKISCPSCKEHFEFPAYAIGRNMSCPHCRATILLK